MNRGKRAGNRDSNDGAIRKWGQVRLKGSSALVTGLRRCPSRRRQAQTAARLRSSCVRQGRAEEAASPRTAGTEQPRSNTKSW